MVMLAPAHAATGTERLDDPRLGPRERVHHLEAADHRAEHGRVLGRQAVPTAGRSVVEVAAGGLGQQPLAAVALMGAGAQRKLGWRERASLREGVVQAELV